MVYLIITVGRRLLLGYFLSISRTKQLIGKVIFPMLRVQKLIDEMAGVWGQITQTIEQARQLLDDDTSGLTADQQQELEATVSDIEQMLEIVSTAHTFCILLWVI